MVTPLFVALVLTAANYALVSGFTSDDAGISFAYARRFANGDPLGVVTRGDAIVEGYSNFTWTMLLSLAERVGVSAAQAATFLSLALVLGTTAAVTLLLRRVVADDRFVWGTVMLSCSSVVVLWAASGLENALVCFLVSVAVLLLVREHDRHVRGEGAQPWSAVMIALLAISRPEGFVYVIAGALAKGLPVGGWRSVARGRAAHALGRWAVVVAVILVPYHVWHYAHFGWVMPNTVYAKSLSLDLGGRLSGLGDLGDPRWHAFGSFLLGTGAVLLAPVVVVGFWTCVRRPRLRGLAFFLVASLALPFAEVDWMPEHRFFSATAVLVVIIAVLGAEETLAYLRSRPALEWPSRMVAIGGVALTMVFLISNEQRLARDRGDGFANQVTMASVADNYRRTVGSAARFGLRDPLVFAPDAGATTFDLDLRLLDSAGLLDAQVAHSHWNQELLRRYVFGERRPDILHTHGSWTVAWGFDEALLEANGYVALDARRDAWGVNGDFVRRDLLFAPASSRPWFRSRTGLQLDAVEVAGVVQPGGALAVRTRWSGSSDEPAMIVVRLVDAEGHELTRTRHWFGHGFVKLSHPRPGEAVQDFARLGIPAAAEPTMYSLEVGLDARGWERAATVPVVVQTPSRRVVQSEARAIEARGQSVAETSVAFHDLADALPSARVLVRKQIAEFRQQQLRRHLLRARAAGQQGRVDDLLRATEEAAVVRGRSWPSAAWRDFADELTGMAMGSRGLVAWKLSRAAVIADPANIEAQRVLIDSRRRAFASVAD